MLARLIANALETKTSLDAEKALKAIRAKSANSKFNRKAKLHQEAVERHIQAEFQEDLERMSEGPEKMN